MRVVASRHAGASNARINDDLVRGISLERASKATALPPASSHRRRASRQGS